MTHGWHSSLKANITFTSGMEEANLQPAFKATAITANSPLDVVVYDAPSRSQMEIECATLNSPARLALPRSFEGRVRQHTDPGFDRIFGDRLELQDPRGDDQRRILDANRKAGPGTFEANVLWIPEVRRVWSTATLATRNGSTFVDLL